MTMQTTKHAVLAALMIVPFTALGAGDAPHVIRLDPSSPGRVFEGIGAVSAGASSRLLLDYPEPQRSQILDFLFKPRFGAGFQHLKVEIGSGENSTCGSEPSHAITRAELSDPKPRGYEFWLMAEARKRNPEIILDCLPWAYPHWVGKRFSQESADWFAAFLETARKHTDWKSIGSPRPRMKWAPISHWIRDNSARRSTARGFSKVKLQAPDDDSHHWKIFDALEKDPEARPRDRRGRLPLCRWSQAVAHRPEKRPSPPPRKPRHSGKPLWASEEWSQSGREWGGKGALYLARLINKLYTRDRITKYEIWCPIDSIYDQIIWPDTGAMQADTPWCGHYTVWPAIWAIAHTTQFAEPGWRYLDGACGQIDADTWRGSHVALCDPKTGDWSVVVVTGDARTVRLDLAAGLKAGPVHVWKSTAAEQFVEQVPPLAPRDDSLELELEADAIYTFTSTTGQRKGSYGTPPARKPFPFPYEEDFESYQPGDTARYFSDQKGTFEVSRRPDGGACLAQIVPAQGILWLGNRLLKPHTLFGDTEWTDCAIEADVLLTGGDVEIGGRYAHRDKLGYRWILARDGAGGSIGRTTTLAAGRLPNFDPATWHHLRLEMNGDRIRGFIDGEALAIRDRCGGCQRHGLPCQHL